MERGGHLCSTLSVSWITHALHKIPHSVLTTASWGRHYCYHCFLSGDTWSQGCKQLASQGARVQVCVIPMSSLRPTPTPGLSSKLQESNGCIHIYKNKPDQGPCGQLLPRCWPSVPFPWSGLFLAFVYFLKPRVGSPVPSASKRKFKGALGSIISVWFISLSSNFLLYRVLVRVPGCYFSKSKKECINPVSEKVQQFACVLVTILSWGFQLTWL